MIFRPVVVVVVALALAPPARADEYSLHALLSTQLSGSDSTFEDGTGADAVVGYQVRPGVQLTYNARRHMEELLVEAGVDGAGITTEGVSLGYRASLRSVFNLTPRLDGNLGVTATGGLTNALTTTAPANVGGPTLVPSNQSEYVGIEGSQGLGYILSPRMTARETAFGRYFQTVGGEFDTVGYELGGGLGIDRTYQVTAIGVEGRASWQRLGSDEVTPGFLDYREQIDVRGTLRIRRDFSERWSGAVDAGVLYLIPRQANEDPVWEPLAGAELAYFPVWGAAMLAVRHTAGPNLMLAQNEVSDSVVVNAALPLPARWLGSTRQQPRLTFLTSTGAAYTRFSDNLSGLPAGRFTVFHADAAFQYLPKPHLAFSLRFQFISQTSTEDVVNPMMQTLGYTRNTVLFMFAGRWPERLAVEMPVQNRTRAREITPVGDDATTGLSSGGGPR
jgi:hypothetical protein